MSAGRFALAARLLRAMSEPGARSLVRTSAAMEDVRTFFALLAMLRPESNGALCLPSLEGSQHVADLFSRAGGWWRISTHSWTSTAGGHVHLVRLGAACPHVPLEYVVVDGRHPSREWTAAEAEGLALWLGAAALPWLKSRSAHLLVLTPQEGCLPDVLLASGSLLLHEVQ